VCARWYAAYPLSLRHIEEMMQERGVFVDHATAQYNHSMHKPDKEQA
jgi:transposase-like protein